MMARPAEGPKRLITFERTTEKRIQSQSTHNNQRRKEKLALLFVSLFCSKLFGKSSFVAV
jgi:hypothetical protein